MKFFDMLEKIYAAAAFAEENQSETALRLADPRAAEQRREKAVSRHRVDSRPRLRL